MTKKAELNHPGEGAFGEFFGFKIETLEPGRAVYSLNVTPKLFNPVGVLHGGVISSLVDQSMGAALTTALPKDQICATIEIVIHYFEAVRDGSIRVETKVIRQGKRVAHIESEVTHLPSGNTVATAMGSFCIFTAGVKKEQ